MGAQVPLMTFLASFKISSLLVVSEDAEDFGLELDALEVGLDSLEVCVPESEDLTLAEDFAAEEYSGGASSDAELESLPQAVKPTLSAERRNAENSEETPAREIKRKRPEKFIA